MSTPREACRGEAGNDDLKSVVPEDAEQVRAARSMAAYLGWKDCRMR